MDIGARIRRLRVASGLTMAALAKRTNLTVSFISQAERNTVTPSIPSIQKIAGALNTSVSAFFDEVRHPKRVVQVRDRRQIRFPREGVIDYLLSPKLSGRLQAILTDAPPGTGSHEYYSHESDEEFVLVLKGRIRISVDKEIYDLNSGDTITFESRLPHKWKTIGTSTARILWVMTPPSY
jgi:transcriptional regulator with XRE-family HTH domain